MTSPQFGSGPVTTGLFINGEEIPGHEHLTVRDPAIPSSIVGYAASASRQQALEAVGAAQAAFPRWAALTPAQRAEKLRASLAGLAAFADVDATLLSAENGKITREAARDVSGFARHFALADTLTDQVAQTKTIPGPPYETVVGYLPVGVVTIIVPFNWPIGILASTLSYALLAGNTVIVKPPPTAPLATVRVTQRIAELLPAGVINIITGEDSEIGTALVQNENVAMVSFTGGGAGGRRIASMASETLTRVSLELGGNDPALILEDALLDADATDRLYHAAFDTTGQICMAIKRLYVHRSRYTELVEALSARLRETVLGHGLDERTTMGPLHSARQREAVAGLIDEARAAGAEVREFGELPRDEALRDGNFLRPALVLDPDASLRIVTDEQFGPALPILPFDTDDEAVAAANDTWAGLGASVWTQDTERALRIGMRMACGYVFINGHGTAALDPRAPFGGIKGSGSGREMGIEGVREFMTTRSIALPSVPAD
ncbi:aldehyde dehydrogenase family protein [Leifsonia sp. Root112D2]|uniref:aldehyde dehydrogenase family protein n=1 Tax=Leifsonia sp. Root112D2 TaxID=1736426 RepID=UPI0006FE4243|nr:aldehyde dehydrogenase family protein [Leifsonia sp. Root112D2]KQV06326.1 aldehyde dehydrogenase [Leifsonia sp. Root112D2]